MKGKTKQILKPGYKQAEIGEIPEEWVVKTIEQTCEILDSQRIPLNEETRKGMKGNIPYYGANGLLDYISDHIFDDELILIAEDGGYFEDYQNRPIAYLVAGKCWVNNHAHVLKVRENGFVTKYIFYTLEHRNILPFIKGSTRSKLNQKDLRSIRIPVPSSSEEQRKIAEILSTADEAIQKTDEIIQKTRELKKGLMQQLLTRGISHTKFKQTEIGEIPEEWEVVRLGDIVLLEYGKGLPEKKRVGGEYPIYGSNGIVGYHSKPLVKGPGIIVGRKGTMGAVSWADSDFWPIDTTYFIKARKHDTFLKWLFLKLVSLNLKKLSLSDVVPGLNRNEVYSLKISLPPLPEQRKIAEILSAVDEKIEVEKRRKEKLEELKKGLMQVLLTGKVRVTGSLESVES